MDLIAGIADEIADFTTVALFVEGLIHFEEDYWAKLLQGDSGSVENSDLMTFDIALDKGESLQFAGFTESVERRCLDGVNLANLGVVYFAK